LGLFGTKAWTASLRENRIHDVNEVEHLTDQHRRALEGEAWHGPAIRDVLKGVTAKVAAARPLPDAHSIWEIVHHIEAWDGSVLGRLIGKPVDMSDPDTDWPPVRDTGPAAWKRSVKSMEATHAKLNRAIAGLTPKRLDQNVAPRRAIKLYHLIHGVIQHEIYHAGQIALLKKG
jgi:uncharacterized damage-inducible protein DinB